MFMTPACRRGGAVGPQAAVPGLAESKRTTIPIPRVPLAVVYPAAAWLGMACWVQAARSGVPPPPLRSHS